MYVGRILWARRIHALRVATVPDHSRDILEALREPSPDANCADALWALETRDAMVFVAGRRHAHCSLRRLIVSLGTVHHAG